ncbi:MAG: aldo/keto reductase [Candidatus Saccharibacteria bacterium]
MTIPLVQIGQGQAIPQIGLGLWQVKDAAEFNRAFDAAIGAGYRHFDSAQVYGNEAMLGDAWQRHGLKREDIFITTKIAIDQFGATRTTRSFAQSLAKLHTSYVDLLLLHFPVPLARQAAWLALEDIQTAGGARNIGVSNYTIKHLQSMSSYAKTKPAVNQVELHVFLQQPELLEYCAAQAIKVEAYSPLAHGKKMADATVASLAEKYGRSYAQIMLRWCVQRGLIVLPKSVTPARIQENIAIFDFELSTEEMQTLAGCDQNLRTCWSPVHVP